MHQIHVSVNFCGREVQMGACDPECLSLVSLINDVLEEVCKRHKYENENFQPIVIIPWSCERQHLKTDLEYINNVNLILEKEFDFLKLEMDVVAMDTLAPVKRRLFNEQTRIFEAYESVYKHTEVQPQQTKQVYSGDANLKRGDQVSEDANEDAYSIDSISWTDEDVCDVVESDSEPEVVCFADLGESDGDDGLSDHHHQIVKALKKMMYLIVKMTRKTLL
ncbi:hypothetical protein AB3S75_023056 [Citrus x aurantiifolia]